MSLYPGWDPYAKIYPLKVISKPNLLERLNSLLKEDLNIKTYNFISSLKTHCERSGGLTEGQLAGLDKVEAYYRPQTKEEKEAWEKKFQTELREKAIICAHYFKDLVVQPGNKTFWREQSKQLLVDEKFILSPRIYKKMCENPYSQKVIKATYCEPKYPIGHLVQFRKNAKVPEKFQEALAIVVLHNVEPVTSAAEGAKKYRVLPCGSAQAIVIEERYLKGARKQKK